MSGELVCTEADVEDRRGVDDLGEDTHLMGIFGNALVSGVITRGTMYNINRKGGSCQ